MISAAGDDDEEDEEDEDKDQGGDEAPVQDLVPRNDIRYEIL